MSPLERFLPTICLYGTNKGTVPVRLLAVYMGAEGKANAEPAAAPPSKQQ